MEKFTVPIEKKDSTISFYDEHGQEYVKNQREFYSQLPDTARKFFRDSLLPNIQNMTIADIGCGAGDDLVAYKEMGAQEVIGIEPSMSMLDEAKKTVGEKKLEVRLVAGEWNHLPLANESVDAITARYSFHVLPNFAKAFAEVARVLKKDGLFIIGAPHPAFDAKMVVEQKLKPGEKIKLPIFDEKFIVENTPHTMDEYLSRECKKHFTIEEKIEYSMEEDSVGAEPTGLLLKLRHK